jgi:type I restriction-modification system DNA methylase subunit
MHTNIY